MDDLQQRFLQAMAQLNAFGQSAKAGLQRVDEGMRNHPTDFLYNNNFGNLVNQAPQIPGFTPAAHLVDKVFYQPMARQGDKNRALMAKDPRTMTPEEQVQLAMMATQIMGSLQDVGGAQTVFRGTGPTTTPKYPGGAYGPGQYFAFDEKTAQQFGPSVTKQMVDPKNSLILNSQADLEQAMRQSIDEGYNSLTEYAHAKGYKFLMDNLAGTVVDVSGLDSMKMAQQFFGANPR